MQFFIMPASVALALTGLCSGSPIEIQAKTRGLAPRATSADITNYSIQCTSTSCSYSATAHILPEDVTISFTGSTSGPTILPNNVIYTPSNPSASLILSRTTFGEYRLNLVYPLNESPSSFTRRWPTGTPEYTTTAYVGSSSFPLTLLA